ncbi:hypothetical protein [Thiopseudomonas alkaliphila]|uniref:hypothetical protein n=1 Tax=Thiopseudomonas alkaliphila TaxID=1697053 RepID=UPI00069D4E09|nr:hypothetical protein [Thiopseudomonas alkaliphila]AKX52508.1 hypothetical protein AKN91_01550 [Thiopseudomonas alkaliphila]MDM1717310.1 hypothetical protein [Thiopseudomonas alkaliphila]
MLEYRVHYLADCDDANWKKYKSANPLKVGDIIELACGFHHVVCAIKAQKTGTRIDVSKSAQDPEEALLLAQQYKHI